MEVAIGILHGRLHADVARGSVDQLTTVKAQDADLVLMLYRDEMYRRDGPDAGVAEIIVAKQRGGETPTVAVAFDRATTTFSDLSEARKAARDERAREGAGGRAMRGFRASRRGGDV